MTINGFNGNFRFLSNFHPCKIEFDGLTYPSVEHAYQAAKTLNQGHRMMIANTGSAGIAKDLGRNLVLRDDWEDVKLSIMETLLRKKFYDPILRAALLHTGDQELIEMNYWHDIFWGMCTCKKHIGTGENHLGKLLMKTREALVGNQAQAVSQA